MIAAKPTRTHWRHMFMPASIARGVTGLRPELPAAAAGPKLRLPIVEISMMRIQGTLLAMVAVGACAVSMTAFADNPAGLYAGVGVGYSTVRSDDPAYGFPGYFNDHQTA